MRTKGIVEKTCFDKFFEEEQIQEENGKHVQTVSILNEKNIRNFSYT